MRTDEGRPSGGAAPESIVVQDILIIAESEPVAAEKSVGNLTFSQCLDLLSLDADELLSVGVKKPGADFKGTQKTVEYLYALASDNPIFEQADFWVCLCPMQRVEEGRGKVQDVVRVAALWADLDVKPGGLGSLEVCQAVIDELANLLGTAPVYVTMTGHGLQPVWAVDSEDSTNVSELSQLLNRFGVVVKTVAGAHWGAADNVFDIARVLRVPGSTNLKESDAPVKVTATEGGGHPLTIAEITIAIDKFESEHPMPLGEQPPALKASGAASEYWTGGSPCPPVSLVLGEALDEIGHDRHGTMRNKLLKLTRLGEQGHEGVADAVKTLHGSFYARVTSESSPNRRSDEGAEREWSNAVKNLDSMIRDKGLTPEEDLGCCAFTIQSEVDGYGVPIKYGRVSFDEDSWFDDPSEVPEFVFPLLVPVGSDVAFYAKSGVGKSLLLLEGAAAVATGGEFLGQSVTRRTVIYIDHEMNKKMAMKRLRSMGYESGSDLSDFHYFCLGDFSSLDTAEGGRALTKLVETHKANVVIIDTLGKAVAGDDDDAKTLNKMHQFTARPLKRRGVTFVRVDHAGKDASKGQRGSSAKQDNVDLVYRLTSGGKDRINVKREKNRDHLDGDDLITLVRSGDPLRHKLTSADSQEESEIDDLVDLLDDLGLAPKAGSPLAREVLKKNGHRVSSQLLAKVIKRRKSLLS